MTSTNISSGFVEEGRPSRKVLRPPGGGSSDIFGPTDAPATLRSIRNHMASNIFGITQDANVKNNADSARRVQKNVDSYSRLFGEPERPFTPAKNHMKSSGGVNSKTNISMAQPTNGYTNKIVAATATKMENGGGESHQNGVTKPDGNPVTGEGYKPAGAEINKTIPCLNGANRVINKNRIPPGGFSSGLW